ncbi:MAG: DUF1501 domain-containing protein [Henriciella sp.]|nr:DUF1501 domain-containing protein [Henriciella sp.]
MAYISRRHMLAGLGTAGFASSLGGLTSLGMNKAWAADTSGYKAIICIFLKGGMDGADTIIPYDQTSYNQLQGIRNGLFGTYNVGSGTSTRNRANLLQLNPDNAASFGGRQYAMPPELAPLHTLFEAGELAVVGNVGPLIEPTTRAQIDNNTAILPKRLFSHNDQQSTWMSFDTEGSRLGWGGKFMDRVVDSSPTENRVFSAIAASANDVFLAGNNVSQFTVTRGDAAKPELYDNRNVLGFANGDEEARQKIRAFLAKRDFQSRNIFEQDSTNALATAVDNSEQYSDARANATPFSTSFSGSNLSNQLQAVAETIKIRQFLSVSRQMYYVSMGGYDTHTGQTGRIGALHADLAESISTFRDAMIEIGEWNNVLVFTASDFGRTLIDNGDGTDHGWGGHHFVTGGQVRGKNFYGDIPTPELNNGQYTPTRGRLIPTTSVEQYAATMGSWFGLNDAELRSALPNLANFNQTNLGFA